MYPVYRSGLRSRFTYVYSTFLSTFSSGNHGLRYVSSSLSLISSRMSRSTSDSCLTPSQDCCSIDSIASLLPHVFGSSFGSHSQTEQSFSEHMPSSGQNGHSHSRSW